MPYKTVPVKDYRDLSRIYVEQIAQSTEVRHLPFGRSLPLLQPAPTTPPAHALLAWAPLPLLHNVVKPLRESSSLVFLK